MSEPTQEKKKSANSGKQRNKPSQKRYTSEKRWERNRVRRMKRHLRNYPNDQQAASLLATA